METLPFEKLLLQAEEARERGYYWEAIELYTALLARTNPDSERSRERELRMAALAERGSLLHQLGEQQAALAGYNQYYLEARNSEQAVDALVSIGEQHSNMGDYTSALDAHREALQRAEALNMTAGRAKALKGIGTALTGLGRLDEAARNLRKAVALFQQVGDYYEEMRSWNSLGIAHSHIGQVDKAIQAYQQALQIARTVGDRQTAITLGNIGECYQTLFDMTNALAYHQEALQVAERVQLDSVEADLRRNLGVDLCYLDRLQEGLLHLYRALELARQAQDPEVEMQALYSLAWAQLRNRHPERSYSHALELQALAEANRSLVYKARGLHAVGLYHRYKGDRTLAEEAWQHALFLAHETGQRFLIWRIHGHLASIAPTHALAAVHRQIATDVIQQIAEAIGDDALRAQFLGAPAVQAILEG